MKPLPAILCLLLVGCQTPVQKAQRIVAPIVKKAERAANIAERQSGALAKQKTTIDAQRGVIVHMGESVKEAVVIAEKIDREHPSGDTARLILTLRVVTRDRDALVLQNQELTASNESLLALTADQKLTLAQLQTEVAKAVPKIATEIQIGRDKAHFWRVIALWEGVGIGAIGTGLFLLFKFKTALMGARFIGPLVSKLFL